VQYGDFGGANIISAYGAFGLTQNLQFELWLGQALGRFSDSVLVNLNITHIMFPDRRYSPLFTLGAGTIETSPKATLVGTTDRRDSFAVAGLGMRAYLTRRFFLRVDYKSYVAFTSRDDNEEVREWKAGFSFFFLSRYSRPELRAVRVSARFRQRSRVSHRSSSRSWTGARSSRPGSTPKTSRSEYLQARSASRTSA
jgi:hypothetical protein